jgi:type I restriction enzyme S subunit
MKLETFFEKFDQLADAPNAVEKMRELVLRLAVTGRLVESDSRDSPASELLASVAAQRVSLVSARRIKARPSLPIRTDAKPFELPPSWEWARLADVGYELGQRIPDTRFTYIDVGSIDSIKGRISDRVEQLEPNEAPSRARKIVARGTVIYSTVRPYLLNIAIVDQDLDPEPIASTAFGILHPFAGFDNRYLYYWLRSAPFTAYVEEGMKGMAYPAINDEKFYSGFIAVPPSAEQRRIVAKVDELMALCDRLEAQQQEWETRHAALVRASLARFADAPTPANLDFLFHPSYTIDPADLRKTILTLAVQGKLVPQDPNDEPAAQALRQSGVEIERWAVKAGDKRHDVPESWVWVRFAGVGEQRLGKMLDAQKNRGEPKPYLRNTNVQWMRFELDDVKEMRVEKGEEDELRLRRGDLVICEGGEPGRCAIWRDELPEMYFQKALHRIRPVYAILSEFLALNLQLDCRNEVLASYFTGATIKHLTGRSLSAYPVPIPPLAEQRRIVAKVAQLMALVDQLETQLAASRATTANLLEAIVAELTAQA